MDNEKSKTILVDSALRLFNNLVVLTTFEAMLNSLAVTDPDIPAKFIDNVVANWKNEMQKISTRDITQILTDVSGGRLEPTKIGLDPNSDIETQLKEHFQEAESISLSIIDETMNNMLSRILKNYNRG